MSVFTKNRNKKKWGEGAVRVGRGGRWTNRLTGPNQFAPLTSSKLGA